MPRLPPGRCLLPWLLPLLLCAAAPVVRPEVDCSPRPAAYALEGRRLLDVTVPLVASTTPVWEDGTDALVRAELSAAGVEGAVATLSRYSLPSHYGTHLDAWKHFSPAGSPSCDGARRDCSQGGADDLLALPLDVLNGAAVLLDVPETSKAVTADFLEASVPEGTTRILLRTRHSRQRSMYQPRFDYNFTALDAGAARWLTQRGVGLIGVDYLSVMTHDDGVEGHLELLGKGVIAVEGLDLHNAPAGEVLLMCLPLAIPGGDGVPTRVVLAFDEQPEGEGTRDEL